MFLQIYDVSKVVTYVGVVQEIRWLEGPSLHILQDLLYMLEEVLHTNSRLEVYKVVVHLVHNSSKLKIKIKLNIQISYLHIGRCKLA